MRHVSIKIIFATLFLPPHLGGTLFITATEAAEGKRAEKEGGLGFSPPAALTASSARLSHEACTPPSPQETRRKSSVFPSAERDSGPPPPLRFYSAPSAPEGCTFHSPSRGDNVSFEEYMLEALSRFKEALLRTREQVEELRQALDAYTTYQLQVTKILEHFKKQLDGIKEDDKKKDCSARVEKLEEAVGNLEAWVFERAKHPNTESLLCEISDINRRLLHLEKRR